MWGRRQKSVAILLALILTGALGDSAAAGPGAGPDPVVERWPTWPYRVTCGSGPFDPVSAFGGPTGVERGSRPSEVALRSFLRRETWVRSLGVPVADWRILWETETEVEFASGRLATGSGPAVMAFTFEDGRWQWDGLSSGCEPRSVIDGMEVVTWRLAADQPPPRKGSRRIWVDLGPGQCSGGRSQNARARRPITHQIGRKLMLVMPLKPLPPGGYTCQGVSERSLRVTLPSRLGSRRLFDGGTYPPRDVVRIWRKRAARGAARGR